MFAIDLHKCAELGRVISDHKPTILTYDLRMHSGYRDISKTHLAFMSPTELDGRPRIFPEGDQKQILIHLLIG